MSIPRPIIREYMEASENLAKVDDLTDMEIEAVQEMMDRLSVMITSQHDSEL